MEESYSWVSDYDGLGVKGPGEGDTGITRRPLACIRGIEGESVIDALLAARWRTCAEDARRTGVFCAGDRGIEERLVLRARLEGRRGDSLRLYLRDDCLGWKGVRESGTSWAPSRSFSIESSDLPRTSFAAIDAQTRNVSPF